MSRVALVFKSFSNDPTVCHAGLAVTANATAQSLVNSGVQAEAWPAVDGYALEETLKAQPMVGNVVMHAAWVDIPFVDGLAGRWPHITFTITSHSNVGFLGSDPFAMRCMRLGAELARRRHNFRISGNTIRFCHWIEQAYGSDCALLPNLYPLKGFTRGELYTGGTLRIGMFGATRHLKNFTTGAAAALVLSKGFPVELHMSQGREEGGAGVLRAIQEMLTDQPGITLVQNEWSDHASFTKIIGNMQICFQPSFTESFNMVTADAISCGVPSVVSPAITWAPEYWQASPDDALDVVRVARSILRNHRAAQDGFTSLARHNEHATAAWKRFLGTH